MNDFLADAEPGRHVGHAKRVLAGLGLTPLRLERREVEQPAELNGDGREQQQALTTSYLRINFMV